jgi:hypothetical protein
MRLLRERDLIYVRFVPLRIPIQLSGLSDLSDIRIYFRVYRTHWTCLLRPSFRHVVGGGVNGSYFLEQVFFHPNVDTDGWVALRSYYESIRGGRPRLPPFPPAPRFWTIPDPELNLRPPASFFDEWIGMVASGEVLSLHPSLSPPAVSPPAGPVAGPSGRGASPSPAPVTGPSTSPTPSSLSSLTELHLTPPTSQPMESPPGSEDGVHDMDLGDD